MSAYVKGEKPRDLDAACGGPTLSRVRGFLKDEDCGMAGPENKQDYSAKGAPAKRQGDTKSKAPIKPRS